MMVGRSQNTHFSHLTAILFFSQWTGEIKYITTYLASSVCLLSHSVSCLDNQVRLGLLNLEDETCLSLSSVSVSLSDSLSVSMSLSLRPTLYLSLSVSVSLSDSLSVFMSLTLCLTLYPSFCLCLSVCLSLTVMWSISPLKCEQGQNVLKLVNSRDALQSMIWKVDHVFISGVCCRRWNG